MSDMVTPDFISEVLKPYFKTDDAREAAVGMVNAMLVTEANMLQITGRELAIASARVLVDFSIGLGGNKFWAANAQSMSTVFATAVMARLNSYEHAADRDRSKLDMVAHVTSRQVMCEIPVHVLLLEQGLPGVRAHGPNLRRAMLKNFGGLVDRFDAR